MVMPGWIWFAGAGVLAAVSLALCAVAASLVQRARGAGTGATVRDELAEAERDLALVEALELVAASPSRKVWADKVATSVAALTGTAGAAVVLRTAGSDSMSLAGSTVPLVIRNLEATLREPHGPSGRALSSGEPVAMSAGELPSWAAAAGYEAGAAVPILFHGASIGLAYALGKPWQAPSPDALQLVARFVSLAAVHYAIAAPFAAPTSVPYPSTQRPPSSRPDVPSFVKHHSPAPSPAPTPPPASRSALAPSPPSPLASTGASAPAAVPELPARSNALSRTAQPPKPAPTPTPLNQAQAGVGATERKRIDLPGVVVDPRTERCVIDGRAVALSKTEFDLLYALASSGGDIVSADQLVKSVWGDSSSAPGSALDVTIHRIRKKLARTPGGAELVRTVRGKGYAIVPPDLTTPASPPAVLRSPTRTAAD